MDIDMASQPDKTELVVRRKNRFSASVAEFLLLFRLRARRGPENSASVMQRALRMVLVTCENWFGRGKADKSGHGKRD
ncbi:MAG: hypothetical protein ABI845_07760 [Polaromonas sp.]